MEKEKKYCVYKITDLRTDEIVYIGKTCNFKHRRSFHFTHDRKPIDKHMYDQGRTNFEMSKIIDDIVDNDTAIKIEDDYIVQLKPIMNKQRSGNIYNDDPNKYTRDYQRQYYNTNKWRDYKKEYNKVYYQKKKLEKQQMGTDN